MFNGSIRRFFTKTVIIVLFFMVTGCASKGPPPTCPQDPYENFNRKVFAFNMTMDRVFFRPVAKVYDTVFPSPIKHGVRNFFANLGSLPVIANALLQLHFAQAIADTARFVINSIVGVGGLFDVASRLGLERDTEDFGLTLGVWGSDKTPYIVLPFFGSYTLRDAVGAPVDYLFFSIWPHINSKKLLYGLQAGNLVQRRADLLIGDGVIDQAFDPYVFVRDAYLQRRAHLVKESKEKHITHYEDEEGVMRRSRRTIPVSSVISDD
jgi:phospholipid-binding lipoprotein MlaA